MSYTLEDVHDHWMELFCRVIDGSIVLHLFVSVIIAQNLLPVVALVDV